MDHLAFSGGPNAFFLPQAPVSKGNAEVRFSRFAKPLRAYYLSDTPVHSVAFLLGFTSVLQVHAFFVKNAPAGPGAVGGGKARTVRRTGRARLSFYAQRRRRRHTRYGLSDASR